MTVTVDLELLERVAQQRRFEPQTLAIAKRLLLYGETPKRLAAEFGVSHQRVYAIRKEVMAAVKELALPPGWEQVTLAGPRSVIAALKAQLKKAIAQHDGSVRRAVKPNGMNRQGHAAPMAGHK
jgi:hypothetical protein